MSNLTPYDTGERATPIPWVSTGSDFTAIHDDRDPDDFGRVDFDNDEGATIATVHLSRREDGGYTIHIACPDDDTQIDWHGEYMPEFLAEAVESDAAPVCDQCPADNGVQTYYDRDLGTDVELCPACYHDARRSGAELA